MIKAVVAGVGAIRLDAIQNADARAHRLVAAPKRKRKRQRFEYAKFVT